MRAAYLIPLLLAGGCATAPLTLNDNLIVPGERIGEIQIGMPLSQLLALKGNPIKTVPMAGTEDSTYLFDGFTVAAHDEVYQIVAMNPRFHTQGGVAPGVEQIFARASYGRPSCVENAGGATTYNYKGVYFSVDNESGKVLQVGVKRNGSTCKVR